MPTKLIIIDRMKNRKLKHIALITISFFLSLLLLEVTLRFFVAPSPNSYGTFLGHELPPIKLVSVVHSPWVNHSDPYDDLIVDGHKITVGDLWGIHREDPLLGFAPEENTNSLNGWWQTNNLGARRGSNTTKERPNGKRRILVFGESFAACSRVPQEDTWPAILESITDDVEVLNFGVDGYSMGQSFLRYREIKNKVDHDMVILMFAPVADLWRDINIRRDLAGGWDPYPLMPRFIINQGELKLISVSSKYNLNDLQIDKKKFEEQLLILLKSYDSFYSYSLFQREWFFAKLILYKLSAVAYHEYKKNKLRAELLEPGSEALQVSHKIFETMHDEVKKDGKKFVLVLLPTHYDLRKFHKDSSYRDRWNRMISSTCALDLICVDLTHDLYQFQQSDLDTAYDGAHYGPKANRQIAHSIMNHLARLEIL